MAGFFIILGILLFFGFLFWFFMGLYLKQIGFDDLYDRHPFRGEKINVRWKTLEIFVIKSSGRSSSFRSRSGSFFQMAADEQYYFFRCNVPGLGSKIIALPKSAVNVEDRHIDLMVTSVSLKILNIPEIDQPISVDLKTFSMVNGA